MTGNKKPLGIDVLTAARRRVATVFDHFERIYVSFSGGKDSSVLLHLTADEARRRGRRFGVLIVDLEGQYRLTIDHVRRCCDLYRDLVDLFWVALPLSLRNAVSQFEPQWLCWDPNRRADWIREPDPRSVVDEAFFPFFRRGMEFEEFVPAFGEWYAQGERTACLVGIRADESLNRYRTVKSTSKETLDGLQWTTRITPNVFNAYPIYDWRTRDIWIYFGQEKRPYNRLYDRMHQAGLSIHQQRICQPYGDDQRKGLWLFHIIEPETWARVVARVNGANQGARYAREAGNILGRIKVSCPEGHTWKSFAQQLLGSMPPRMREHFENKIAIWLKWWADHRGVTEIPDEADRKVEAAHAAPTWRRVCKMLLRNDYWCKDFHFAPHKSPDSYKRYLELMRRRREQWNMTTLP